MRLPVPPPALWCLLAAALFGASTPVAKVLLDGMGPVTLSGLFYAGAALATAPVALRARWSLAELPRLVGACLLGGVAGPILVFLGLRLAPAGTVALWLNLEAPATALLGWLFFREHLGARAWGAAALTFLASVVLTGAFGGGVAEGGGPPSAPSWMAISLVTAGCVAWGFDNHLTALLESYTPAQTTFVKGVVAASVNLALGYALEGRPGAGVVTALGVGALAYGASIALYVAGAQQLGATRAQLLFATAPFWGVVLAWSREPVLAEQVVAGVVMLGALVLAHGERHAHAHTHEAVRHTHWHRHDDEHHDHHEGAVGGWHVHAHAHEAVTHDHAHVPDLHHRHGHGG